MTLTEAVCNVLLYTKATYPFSQYKNSQRIPRKLCFMKGHCGNVFWPVTPETDISNTVILYLQLKQDLV